MVTVEGLLGEFLQTVSVKFSVQIKIIAHVLGYNMEEYRLNMTGFF